MYFNFIIVSKKSKNLGWQCKDNLKTKTLKIVAREFG
jgi:hypothetical protein